MVRPHPQKSLALTQPTFGGIDVGASPSKAVMQPPSDRMAMAGTGGKKVIRGEEEKEGGQHESPRVDISFKEPVQTTPLKLLSSLNLDDGISIEHVE